jgi:hypothetical protein
VTETGTATATPTETATTTPTETITTEPTTVPTTTQTSLITTPTTPVTTGTGTPIPQTTIPLVTGTTVRDPFQTAPETTIPITAPVTPAVNTTGTLFLPVFGNISGLPFLLVMGGICCVLVMIDLFLQPVTAPTISGKRRGLISTAYILIIGGLGTGLLFFQVLSNQGQISSPYIFILVPIAVYLIVSCLFLIAGTLLARPLRWALGGHILFSIICAFTAVLALIGSLPEVRTPLVLTFASAVLGGIAARWEFNVFGSGVSGERTVRDDNGGTSPDATVIPDRTLPVPESFPTDLLDRYTRPVLIGMGGIARVFKAENNLTGEEVALKIPVSFNETAGRCFMKEIKAWEDLRHENIVSIREANILPVPYIEMEYIGKSLSDVKKPIPPDEAARIIRGIAAGLSYAHSQGIIHRDIKPQNILMTPEGVPKITDWGMSKVMGACLLPTITGFSLSYAAPEQIAPEKYGDTSQRTDIYQLGVVFYELLTGELPFAGEDITRVSSRILSDEPHDPSSLNPFAFPLDHIIRKCLEKDQADRYHDIEEVIAALDLYHSMRIESGHYEVFEDY